MGELLATFLNNVLHVFFDLYFSRPPDGCTQWYTGTHGRLTSFNFESNTQHLSSLNYNICIRKEKGFCCIKYDVCPDENSFSFHATGGNMALVEENCRTDYLTIEGSSSICRLNRLTNRYCGEFLADENKVESNLQICGKFAKTI